MTRLPLITSTSQDWQHIDNLLKGSCDKGLEPLLCLQTYQKQHQSLTSRVLSQVLPQEAFRPQKHRKIRLDHGMQYDRHI